MILIAVLVCSPAPADEPEMIVETDRTRLYEGESLLYRVTLNHVERPSEPDMGPLEKDFDVVSLGQQSLNSRSVTVINGKMSEIVRYGRQYNYRLTPLRSGRLTIPSPTAVVDGRTLRGREVQLTVLPPDAQDVVRMEIIADKRSVYPMQPFEVTLTIAVKALPSPYENENPLGVQSKPPELKIPWAIDDKLPAGLRPNTDWQHWLGEIQNGRGAGFNVNNLRQESILSLFNEPRLTFLPKAEKVRLADGSGKMADYWRYEFTRKFTSDKTGDYTFGPATLKGAFVTAVEEGRPVGEGIYAVAKPATVVVKDVPVEGRPDCYVGAIGKFDITATLTPRKVRTGDPMTLTLVMTGDGAWEGVSPPVLGNIPAIAEHFKIYEATEQSKGNGREFTYSLRPLDAEITEFPAVPAAYFNVDDDRYVTIHSDPILIEVTKAERLAGRDIITPLGGNGGHRPLEACKEGIFANITDPSQVVDQSVHPRTWLIALAGLIGAYALLRATVSWRRHVGGDVALQRRKAAWGGARQGLRRATAVLASGGDREGADLVRAALLGLIADLLDLNAAGLTPGEACRRLESLCVDAKLVARLRTLLDACEGVRYGAGGGASAELGKDAEELLRPLAAAIKKVR